MGEYYIKKLKWQEMGSPTLKQDGTYKFHRGRYLLVTKDGLDFFPHLSSVILNDSTAIPIKPQFTENLVYAQYVYHNSLLIPEEQRSGVADRNEHRLYLNNDLDDNKRYFRPNDIIVFEKKRDEDMIYFNMNLFPPEDTLHYNILNDILEGKTTVIYSGELDFLPVSPITRDNISIGDQRVIDAIGNKQEQMIQTRENESLTEEQLGANLFNSRSFREFVMLAYNYKCAITQQVISCNGFINLEAAHIKPQAHNGAFLPCNGIAMSRDLHFAFDKGFFTLTPDYRVKIHEDVLNTDSYINQYNNAKIFVPQVEYFRPREEFLIHHRQHVYGSFRQIRSGLTQ
ncbi:MAG: HNH endonuclease [Muribaculaceae bacterium]|nr:HNH endonuclease [Muribaculaceae bacterium]